MGAIGSIAFAFNTVILPELQVLYTLTSAFHHSHQSHQSHHKLAAAWANSSIVLLFAGLSDTVPVCVDTLVSQCCASMQGSMLDALCCTHLRHCMIQTCMHSHLPDAASTVSFELNPVIALLRDRKHCV